MRINRLCKPHPVLETESTVGERAYRTNIDHVSDELVVQVILNECSDLRMITTVQYAMLAVFRNLVGRIHAAVA